MPAVDGIFLALLHPPPGEPLRPRFPARRNLPRRRARRLHEGRRGLHQRTRKKGGSSMILRVEVIIAIAALTLAIVALTVAAR